MKCEESVQLMLARFDQNLGTFHHYPASKASHIRLQICYYTSFIHNGFLKPEGTNLIKSHLKIERYKLSIKPPSLCTPGSIV